MLRKSSRKFLKQALWWARVKLVYSRITLTKFTTLYFFTALLTCIVLSTLQAITYFDNKFAGDLFQAIRERGNSTAGIVVETSGRLELCMDLPGQPGANCTRVSSRKADDINTRREIFDIAISHYYPRELDYDVVPELGSSGSIEGVKLDGKTRMSSNCLHSLHWFNDIVRDAKREDVVTLAFEVWLFSLSVVAILNESLPHLAAGMAAHVLGTSWAAFRAANSKTQEAMYRHLIVNGACGVDILGNWWNTRHIHTYIIIGFNILALFASSYLTFRLYKVYSAHSFRLAGESPVLHAAYKKVLLLSVLLQLSGFFILGSTGLWIDKISFGAIHAVTRNFAVFLAIFIAIAVVDIPWLVLGWISVRREKRLYFFGFCVLSFLMLVASTLMFASPLFRFIFDVWPFFAVMTITAYVLTVATPVAAVLCRLQFGRGLPAYLKKTEVLEGEDFTPVYFPHDSKHSSLSSEASFGNDSEKGHIGVKSMQDDDLSQLNTLSYIQPPKSAYTKPIPRQKISMPRVVTSVYSDITRDTVKLSTTPPLAQAPSPLSAAASQHRLGPLSSTSPQRTSPLSRVPGVHTGLPTNPRPF